MGRYDTKAAKWPRFRSQTRPIPMERHLCALSFFRLGSTTRPISGNLREWSGATPVQRGARAIAISASSHSARFTELLTTMVVDSRSTLRLVICHMGDRYRFNHLTRREPFLVENN